MTTDQIYKSAIITVSLAVPAVVVLLFYITPPDLQLSFDIHFFPALNAILNSLTTLCLLFGFYFIKNKNIIMHRRMMLTSLVLSAIFLVSYVFYHMVSEPTLFGGSGFVKYAYYVILISHVVLAALILPLILFTFYRALFKQFELHKKLARYTFPLWLYVTVTGVLVYLMISPYYA